MTPSTPPALTDPALSIVVSSTHPWPEARACLESLHGQAQAHGVEVVLGHRGDGFPDEQRAAFPEVVPLVGRGASSNELRAIALQRGSADVVAMTDSHCVPAADWCEAILTAHREHPEAAAIGGAVENGSTDHALDWAAFFLNGGPVMLPLLDGPAEKIDGHHNVSYKRWALPQEPCDGGFFDRTHHAELLRRGEVLVADSRMVVHHVQSLGLGACCWHWFQVARLEAAQRGRHMTSGQRALRALMTPVRHPLATALHVREVWAKRRLRRRMVAVSPLMALLALCATSGLACGFAFGAGSSVEHGG